MSSPLNYKLLWTQELNTGAAMELTAEKIAQTWPGFPSNPTRPTDRALDRFPFPMPVLPVKSSRKRRGRGYANLSNYNTIP